jgi:hypothetical protein
MRFSIRDLMWLTLVVALSLGWWFSHQAIDAERNLAVDQNRQLWMALREAKSNHDYSVWVLGNPPPINWQLLDEPPVRP